MNTFKHLLGILLAAISVLVMLSSLSLVLAPDTEVSIGMLLGVLLCLGVAPATGAFFLLRPMVKAPIRGCPTCGSHERKTMFSLQNKKSVWVILFVGWLWASLLGASQRQRVRCARCDETYLTDTKWTRVAGLAVWVVVVMLLISVVTEAFVPE